MKGTFKVPSRRYYHRALLNAASRLENSGAMLEAEILRDLAATLRHMSPTAFREAAERWKVFVR